MFTLVSISQRVCQLNRSSCPLPHNLWQPTRYRAERHKEKQNDSIGCIWLDISAKPMKNFKRAHITFGTKFVLVYRLDRPPKDRRSPCMSSGNGKRRWFVNRRCNAQQEIEAGGGRRLARALQSMTRRWHTAINLRFRFILDKLVETRYEHRFNHASPLFPVQGGGALWLMIFFKHCAVHCLPSVAFRLYISDNTK